MPKYWMISNRNVRPDGLGKDVAGASYWVGDGGDLGRFANWTRLKPQEFRKQLIDAADKFPLLPHARHEEQKQVVLLVHGYNNSWDEAARWYQAFTDKMFDSSEGLGHCVLYSWPSNGSLLGYRPDRRDAETSAPVLADILIALYRWLEQKQEDVLKDESLACRAKTSLIAHSMGNYVLQKAMQSAWTSLNRPASSTLVNQLLMVAADVDNDIFKCGDNSDGSDGDAITNLCYRITSLFTGRDATLGASAGLKHSFTRRLGRSGLHKEAGKPSNVWEYDCSGLMDENVGGFDAHSAYFSERGTLDLMHRILRGLDREVVMRKAGPP